MPKTLLEQLLHLDIAPIAISFADSPPPGVKRVHHPGPASCAYWKLAAQGETFYTEAADHLNCPVGAHTHGATVPPERKGELMDILQTMVGLEYLKMEEVPSIAHRKQTFGAVIY